jgi:hypothetical protein
VADPALGGQTLLNTALLLLADVAALPSVYCQIKVVVGLWPFVAKSSLPLGIVCIIHMSVH